MISIILLALFTILVIYKINNAFLLLVFFYPILPKYMNIELGSNIYISYQTAMLGIILIFTILIFLSGQINVKNLVIFKDKKIYLSLLFFLVIKIISTLLYSPNISGGLVSITYYTLDSLIILILASVYIKNNYMLSKLLYTILFSYIIVLVIAYIEKLYGQNIFMNIVDIRYDFYNDMVSGNSRNNEYRIMASFQNTLLLTAYLSILLPLSMVIIHNTKSKKIFKYLLFLISALAIYWTYSRTGLFLLAFFITIIFINIFYNTVSLKVKKFTLKFIFVNLVIMSILLVSNFNVIFEIMMNASSNDGEQSSLVSRYNQFSIISNIIDNQMLLGTGTTRNILSTNEEIKTIDNFYLRLFIESGLLGISGFIAFLIFTILSAFNTLKKKLLFHDFRLLKASLISLILFIIDLFVTSIPNHHIFLYLIVFIIIYLNNKYINDSPVLIKR